MDDTNPVMAEMRGMIHGARIRFIEQADPLVENASQEVRDFAATLVGTIGELSPEEAIQGLRSFIAARQYEQRLREFVGWLSADIPELHGVEVPRLAESLARFLAATSTP